MPIPEIDKFREKYPQYKDIDDNTLATKLAQKYPQAYGDLPKKVPVGDMIGSNLKNAVQGTVESVGVAGNTALLGLPGAVSQLMTGGKPVIPFTDGNGMNTVKGGTNVFEGKDLSGMDKAMAEGLGMIAPVSEGLSLLGKTPAAKAIGGVLKYSKPDEQAKLADTVRKSVYQAKTDAVNEFGEGIDNLARANPDKSVSLRNVVDGIKSNMEEMAPEARSVLRKTPILKDLLEKPELANNVSLKDTQDIINYINTKVPRNIKANHLDILDTLNDTRAAQLEAFPEMSVVRAKYGEFKNAFDTIKNKLKKGSLVDNMAKDFGDIEIQKEIRKVFNEDMLKEVKKFQQSKKILKATGIISDYALKGAAGAAGAGVIYEGGKKLSGE